jgi:hypothetical protein
MNSYPPAETTPDTQVRLFIPSQESAQQESLREEIVRIIAENKWGIAVRRSHRHTVTQGRAQGRPYDLVEPNHAAEAYKTAHRAHTLVITTGACYVRRNPSKDPRVLGDLISIQNFVQYKAMFTMIRGRADVAQAIADFNGWPHGRVSSELHDPRLLPLHIFDNGTDWLELDQPLGVAEFDNRFGPARKRTDPAGRSWIQSTAFHGREALSVAGYQLNPGFHWDVERGRGEERIYTAHEIWKLSNKASYCNIYPDGYIRKGRNLAAGSCRRVWSAA